MLSIRNAKKKENNEIIEKYNLNWTTFPSHFTNKIKYSGKLKYFLFTFINNCLRMRKYYLISQMFPLPRCNPLKEV
jgi:hypothetical protein